MTRCLSVYRLLLPFLALGYSISVNAQSRGPDKPVMVVAQPLPFETEQTRVDAVGTAEAFKSVDLFPAAADKVTQVNFVPGQRVNKNEVLIELDARRQKVAVTRAEIQLKEAERSLKRLQDSKQVGAVTESALDQAKTQRDLAKVALQDAQSDLQDRRLLAPFTGIVGLTSIEVGDRITMQTLVTTIDSREKLYVNFSAPESALDLLLGDAEVTLHPWTDRSKTLSATIAQLDSRVDQQARTIRARALLENPHDAFRPGMSFRVNLLVKGQLYAAIPEAALSWGATGAYIWLAKQGKAQKVAVQVKQRLRGRILVDGPLSPDDQLIVEGVQLLREGQSIQYQQTTGA
ncbi:efflux RND transporter periplasmic adaptor subunit [Neptunicella sp. SCSIO 80796]|uniref:efflux RND transporter periplasmic adaptor subunit n=1 Tax=Neptunicella plasticusilytica TaxID=3117012 RepID=UPI003A4E6024